MLKLGYKTRKLSLGVFFCLGIIACSNSKIETVNYGHAQGTTYSIRYIQDVKHDYQKSIDSILINIDKSMSLWVETSIISKVNRGEPGVELDAHFKNVLNSAQAISTETNGKFDATVAPLVSAWGFNGGGYNTLDSATVDSLLELVDYTKVSMTDNEIKKGKNQQLDFNAIAQGYSVDVICDFLEAKGIHDYMVEVGGELRTLGTNSNGEVWRIGIDKPQAELDSENRFQIILNLSGKALATSGNYRKFFTDESGMKYVHTIHPKTGYPVKSNLLSTTIITDNCMNADGYATACMVGGVRNAQLLIEKNEALEGYLIYSDSKGEMKEWFSKNFESFK